jgi:phage terminase large subunit GpA-like protein
MVNLLNATRAYALASLIPPPRLRLSEWIEREIVLPEGVSALPGAVRLWPYQREIANAIKDPACERVTLLKPTRVGEAPRLRLAARAVWPWPP